MGLLRTIEGLLLLLLRLALGGVFLYAAWVKIHDPKAAQTFAESIKGFKLLPESGDHLVVLATFVVPWVEAIAGACLVVGLWSRGAAGVILLNLLAFSAAIYSVLARGMSTKCGCFGKFSPFCPEEITSCNLIQNGAMAAVALLLMIRGGGLLALDGRPKKAGGSTGAAAPSAPSATGPAPRGPSSMASPASPSIRQVAGASKAKSASPAQPAAPAPAPNAAGGGRTPGSGPAGPVRPAQGR